MQVRAAHGIRVGHLIQTTGVPWSEVIAVDDRRDRGYIRITVEDHEPIDFPTMQHIEYRCQHSEDAGLKRITMRDGAAWCPNDGPHIPHTNAIFTDWQAAESWDCNGEPG